MNIYDYINVPNEFKCLFISAQPWNAIDNISSFIESHNVDCNGNIVHITSEISHNAIVINSYIGANTRVYEFVNIRNSILGANIQIGHCSEIVKSIILNKSSIPRFNYIGASIIGNNVRFGGICSFASRRIDDALIFISENGKRYETYKNKFGAIIGDNTIIGFAAHGNPGTMIGRNSIIMPHVEIKGIIPENSIVSMQQKLLISKKRNVDHLGLNNLER